MKMSDNQIDEYRQPWESDEHWILRKEFIEHYKNDFPEDRLLCLAQAYSNVELLGCSYPTHVMYQINELAKDLRVCDTLRRNRKDRAGIKFVKEEKNNSKNSDPRSKRSFPEVSESIHKFSKLSPCVLTCNKNKAINMLTCDKNRAVNTFSSIKTDPFVENFGEHDPVLKILPNADTKTASSRSSFNSSPKPISDDSLCHVDVPIPNKIVSNLQSDIQDQNATMVVPEFMQTISKDVCKFLRKSLFKKITPPVVLNDLKKFHINVKFKIHLLPNTEKRCPMFQCEVEINDALFSSAQGSSKKKARSEAAKQAVEKLMHALPSASSNSQVASHPKVSDSVNRIPDPAIIKLNYPVTCKIKTRKKIHADDSPRMLVLLDYTDIRKVEGPVTTLVDSANFNRVPLKFEFEDYPWALENIPMKKASVIFNGHSISSAIGYTKQVAKQKASEIALAKLRKISYTIKVKDEHNDGFIVSRKQVFDITGPDNSLSENNVGCKMLKMMGWSGGGIGKLGNEGIEEPVKTTESHKRGQGLGFTSNNDLRNFTSRLEQIIHDYAKSNSTSDLIFASDFSIEERKEIHWIANKYSLKNNSRGGKGNGRHVVVSRRFTPKELLERLLSEGGSTHKYELVDKMG